MKHVDSKVIKKNQAESCQCVEVTTFISTYIMHIMKTTLNKTNVSKQIVFKSGFNLILHTEWLDSHALTLKNYTAKYYEVRKF